jgi:hypothetical protein
MAGQYCGRLCYWFFYFFKWIFFRSEVRRGEIIWPGPQLASPGGEMGLQLASPGGEITCANLPHLLWWVDSRSLYTTGAPFIKALISL